VHVSLQSGCFPLKKTVLNSSERLVLISFVLNILPVIINESTDCAQVSLQSGCFSPEEDGSKFNRNVGSDLFRMEHVMFAVRDVRGGLCCCWWRE
jgi:hypothetical protein